MAQCCAATPHNSGDRSTSASADGRQVGFSDTIHIASLSLSSGSSSLSSPDQGVTVATTLSRLTSLRKGIVDSITPIAPGLVTPLVRVLMITSHSRSMHPMLPQLVSARVTLR